MLVTASIPLFCGSSVKSVPGVVEVIEPEFEVFHVSEAVGLALHGFDFVVESFQGALVILCG